MIYTVKRIAEADYGCEERMPGEPTMVFCIRNADIFLKKCRKNFTFLQIFLKRARTVLLTQSVI